MSDGGEPSATVAPLGLKTRLSGIQTFRSLRYRNYRLLWIGILISAAGVWMEQVAISWLVWKLTESTFLVGILHMLRSFPLLLVSPFGGVIADRFDRRRVFLVTQAAPFLLAALLATLVVTGLVEVWHVMLIGLGGGMVHGVYNPVRQALIPSLVEREDLMNAVALQGSGFHLMGMLGPVFAGNLIWLMGIERVFVLIATLYALVVIITFQIRIPPQVRTGPVLPVVQSLREGFGYIAGQPLIASLLILAMFPIMFGWSVTTLLPTFADTILNAGERGYGWLMTALGLGAVTATFTVASMRGGWPKGKLIVGAVPVLGLAIIAFAFSPSLLLSLPLLVIAGAARMVFMALMTTSIQLIVPDALRGRVMSVVMLDWGLTAVGSFLAGSLAGVFDVQTTAVFLGSMCVLAGSFAWLHVPVIRNFR